MAAGAASLVQAQERDQIRIIDPHVHVWGLDRNYPFAKETKNPPAEEATPEMLLDLMQAEQRVQHSHHSGDSLSLGQ